MEFMNGRTLRERMNSTALRIPEVVEIGIQVADALAAAHSRGIIHRDIKPDNVFLTEDGFVKVLDFGLAKLLLQQGPNIESTAIPSGTLTNVGDMLGTISYMSPEQASGEPLDSRTDLFSLGVVLYQCATGHAPFTGKTIAVVLSAILNKAPVAPMALNPDVPSRLQDVIYSCLEKDRELRCPSADDLRVQLKRVKRDLEFANLSSAAISPQDRGTPESSGSTGASLPVTSSVTAPRPSDQQNPRGRAARVGILAALVLISGALYWAFTGRPSTSETVTNVGAENSGEDLLHRAGARLSSRDYRGAAADASEVLRRTPGNAAATALLEQAQSQLRRFDQSIADARRWLDSGDTRRVEQALEVARSIDPTASEVATLSARLVGQLSAETRAAQEIARQATDAARSPAPPASAPPSQPPPAISTPPVSVPEPAQRPREEAPPAETQPARPESRPAQTPPAAATAPAAAGTNAPARSVSSEANIRSPEPSPPAQPAAVPPPAAAQPPASNGRTGAAPSTDEADRTAIRGVIDSYRQAIETQNLDLIRRIKPNLSAAEARRFTEGFRAVSSQKVDFTILSIELNGNNSIVRLNRRDTLQAAGAPAQSAVSQQTIHLIRTGGRWVIDAIGQ
jgi:hypothetical protein